MVEREEERRILAEVELKSRSRCLDVCHSVLKITGKIYRKSSLWPGLENDEDSDGRPLI